MSLSITELKHKACFLLNVFELYHFKNRLSYSRNVNLVLEFCDYINQMPDWQLLAELESEEVIDATNFRNLIDSGIDDWLNHYIKTICF